MGSHSLSSSVIKSPLNFIFLRCIALLMFFMTPCLWLARMAITVLVTCIGITWAILFAILRRCLRSLLSTFPYLRLPFRPVIAVAREVLFSLSWIIWLLSWGFINAGSGFYIVYTAIRILCAVAMFSCVRLVREILTRFQQMYYAIICLTENDPLKRKVPRLLLRLQTAETYNEWVKIAAQLDEAEGQNAWRKEVTSSHYDYQTLGRQLAAIANARASGSADQLEFALHAVFHRDFCGVEGKELYSFARTGTKRLVEDYYRTIVDQLVFMARLPPPSIASSSSSSSDSWLSTPLIATTLSASLSSSSGTMTSFPCNSTSTLGSPQDLPYLKASSNSNSALVSSSSPSLTSSALSSTSKTSRASPPSSALHPSYSRPQDAPTSFSPSHIPFDAYPLSRKYRFFKNARKTFGRTALCLSGGGALSMYHVGVVRCLLTHDCLPSVIAGTSGGSIVAALVCTRTDAELLQPGFLSPSLATRFRRRWLPSLYQQIISFINTGVLADASMIASTCKVYFGDLTFEEAFLLSGRSLNITVAAASVRGASGKLENGRSGGITLNHLITPRVYVWSAVLCSCALPGLIHPQPLYAKDSQGRPVLFYSQNCEWLDGTFLSDIPHARLSELFNVTKFIVSQVNPHIRPFLGSLSPQAGRAFPKLAALEGHLSSSIAHFVSRLASSRAIPRVYGQSLARMTEPGQRYHGDITILPHIDFWYQFKVLRHPTEQDMDGYITSGEQATWPSLTRIRNGLVLERTLHAAIKYIEAQAQQIGTPLTFPLRLKYYHNQQQRHGNSGTNRSSAPRADDASSTSPTSSSMTLSSMPQPSSSSSSSQSSSDYKVSSSFNKPSEINYYPSNSPISTSLSPNPNQTSSNPIRGSIPVSHNTGTASPDESPQLTTTGSVVSWPAPIGSPCLASPYTQYLNQTAALTLSPIDSLPIRNIASNKSLDPMYRHMTPMPSLTPAMIPPDTTPHSFSSSSSSSSSSPSDTDGRGDGSTLSNPNQGMGLSPPNYMTAPMSSQITGKVTLDQFFPPVSNNSVVVLPQSSRQVGYPLQSTGTNILTPHPMIRPHTHLFGGSPSSPQFIPRYRTNTDAYPIPGTSASSFPPQPIRPQPSNEMSATESSSMSFTGPTPSELQAIPLSRLALHRSSSQTSSPSPTLSSTASSSTAASVNRGILPTHPSIQQHRRPSVPPSTEPNRVSHSNNQAPPQSPSSSTSASTSSTWHVVQHPHSPSKKTTKQGHQPTSTDNQFRGQSLNGTAPPCHEGHSTLASSPSSSPSGQMIEASQQGSEPDTNMSFPASSSQSSPRQSDSEVYNSQGNRSHHGPSESPQYRRDLRLPTSLSTSSFSTIPTAPSELASNTPQGRASVDALPLDTPARRPLIQSFSNNNVFVANPSNTPPSHPSSASPSAPLTPPTPTSTSASSTTSSSALVSESVPAGSSTALPTYTKTEAEQDKAAMASLEAEATLRQFPPPLSSSVSQSSETHQGNDVSCESKAEPGSTLPSSQSDDAPSTTSTSDAQQTNITDSNRGNTSRQSVGSLTPAAKSSSHKHKGGKRKGHAR